MSNESWQVRVSGTVAAAILVAGWVFFAWLYFYG